MRVFFVFCLFNGRGWMDGMSCSFFFGDFGTIDL